MRDIKTNLVYLLAGSYGLTTLIILYLNFQSPRSWSLTLVAIILTLPWSIVVILLGFLLIHLSIYGMEYGFVVGALLNLIFIFIIGLRLARRTGHSALSKT